MHCSLAQLRECGCAVDFSGFSVGNDSRAAATRELIAGRAQLNLGASSEFLPLTPTKGGC